MFSKVSRSLAQFTLVNSVSTLLNKGGSTCNCPKASQDFCVNQNKQASAQLLCSSLVLSRHEQSEGRRNSCEAEKYTYSEQHAPLQGCLRDISGVFCSSWPTQKHANMPKSCHKHAKVHADVCSGKNTYQSQKTDRGHTRRKHIFPRSELRRGLWPVWSKAQQEVKLVRELRSERASGGASHPINPRREHWSDYLVKR